MFGLLLQYLIKFSVRVSVYHLILDGPIYRTLMNPFIARDVLRDDSEERLILPVNMLHQFHEIYKEKLHPVHETRVYVYMKVARTVYKNTRMTIKFAHVYQTRACLSKLGTSTKHMHFYQNCAWNDKLTHNRQRVVHMIIKDFAVCFWDQNKIFCSNSLQVNH